MLLFVDLETTGLNPHKNSVLEIAAIATDDALEERARFHAVIYNPWAEDIISREGEDRSSYAAAVKIDQFVVDMHDKNGLWRECATSPNRLEDVDRLLAEFISVHACERGQILMPDQTLRPHVNRPQLAGSTISFDRSFMQEDLPLAHAELHYRNVDVTALSEMAKRFWPGVYAARPRGPEVAVHRAMEDIVLSLETARYYARALGDVAPLRAIMTKAQGILGDVAKGEIDLARAEETFEDLLQAMR